MSRRSPQQPIEHDISRLTLPLLPSTILTIVLAIIISIVSPPLGSLAMTGGYITWILIIDILLCLSSNFRLARYHALLWILWSVWTSWRGLWVHRTELVGVGVGKEVRRRARVKGSVGLGISFKQTGCITNFAGNNPRRVA